MALDKTGMEFAIFDTYMNLEKHLMDHESVAVGVSGGSDSNIIVHMLATHFPQCLHKCHFEFEDTGLEYDATKRHLAWMEEHYGIKIDRNKGESVVSVVRRCGLPVLSKEFSKVVNEASRGCPGALKKMAYTRKESRFALSATQRAMADHIIKNKIQISYECCNQSKKKPHKAYLKRVGADLTLSGERQAEGGIRAVAHKGCFESGKGKNKVDKYMPLFWWDDATKEYYKQKEGIRFSDCYEVWGMQRTGCVGCPFNSRAGQDLQLMKKYEPSRYHACLHVFGESYKLMDQFGVHRHKILDEEAEAEIDAYLAKRAAREQIRTQQGGKADG